MRLHFRNMVFWLTSIFVLSLGNVAFAQTEKNPFDIGTQQREEKKVDVERAGNPFDLNTSKSIGQNTPSKEIASTGETNEPVVAGGDNFNSFLLFVMLLVFLIFSVVAIVFKDLLKKVFDAFSNERLLNLLHGEKTVIRIPLFIIFIFIYALNAGVFVFLSIVNLLGVGDWKYFSLLVASIFMVTFPFAVKYVLLKVIGWIFSIQKEVNSYLFTIYIFFIAIGVVLFPINIIIAYGAESLKTFLIYFTFIALFLVLIFRLIRGLFIGMRFMSFHIFHFLLYLCAVEIVPALILIKVFTKYFG